MLGDRPDSDLQRSVEITFDDGCTMDFLDMVHPTWGLQQSFCNILREHRDGLEPDARPLVQATSFVIGSPDTRRRLGESRGAAVDLGRVVGGRRALRDPRRPEP